MNLSNCWEFKACGREPDGLNCSDLGVCPAATETKLDAVNRGKNGGRACWAITGTLCKGEVQGVYAQKIGDCMKCDFYRLVQYEEGEKFTFTKEILEIIQ